MKKHKKELSMASLVLALCLALFGCAEGQGDAAYAGTLLREDEDAGEEYIDSFIFLGESTTYHMKSRGVLRGGTETEQVWSNRLGTINLDGTVAGLCVVYPETGEELPLGDALRRSKPQRILLTFGLNGAVDKIRRGREYFCACYRDLIEVIRASSPNTEIILQSCFPIGESMDMSAFTVDAATLNGYICEINGWTLSLAAEEGLGYLDTCEALMDGRGFLRSEYCAEDAYHLNTDAYAEILRYIRTHPSERWKNER